MTKVIWGADAPPETRSVIVRAHGKLGGKVKAYFFDSEAGDHGGSAGFDWLLEEAVERATAFAKKNGIDQVCILKIPNA